MSVLTSLIIISIILIMVIVIDIIITFLNTNNYSVRNTDIFITKLI